MCSKTQENANRVEPCTRDENFAKKHKPDAACRHLSSERRSSGAAGQEERKTPDGAPYGDGARSGRGQSGGRRRRLHRGGPRLSREQQGRETLLGDDGNIVQRAGQHGRAARLLRRRVLLQERQHLRPKPAAGLHHEGDQRRVRVELRRVPLPFSTLKFLRKNC